MSIESALRELGKEIQKDERFVALQVAAKANDADESLQQQMQESSLSLLNISRRLKKERKHHKTELRNFRTIIRSFILKLWQAKICKTILPLHLKWKRWRSISAV